MHRSISSELNETKNTRRWFRRSQKAATFFWSSSLAANVTLFTVSRSLAAARGVTLMSVTIVPRTEITSVGLILMSASQVRPPSDRACSHGRDPKFAPQFWERAEHMTIRRAMTVLQPGKHWLYADEKPHGAARVFVASVGGVFVDVQVGAVTIAQTWINGPMSFSFMPGDLALRGVRVLFDVKENPIEAAVFAEEINDPFLEVDRSYDAWCSAKGRVEHASLYGAPASAQVELMQALVLAEARYHEAIAAVRAE